MFTGIVEELGRFVSAERDRYRFEASLVLEGSELGASIGFATPGPSPVSSPGPSTGSP